MSYTRPAGDKRMFFCGLHRERFLRLEDTEPVPPSAALVAALEANADFERSELERYGNLHFEQDTKDRGRLESLLGLPKTNWWKRVIDAAEVELLRLRRELADANDGLAALTKDIESLCVDDAPWPETLEAIKAAMRIERLKRLVPPTVCGCAACRGDQLVAAPIAAPPAQPAAVEPSERALREAWDSESELSVNDLARINKARERVLANAGEPAVPVAGEPVNPDPKLWVRRATVDCIVDTSYRIEKERDAALEQVEALTVRTALQSKAYAQLNGDLTAANARVEELQKQLSESEAAITESEAVLCGCDESKALRIELAALRARLARAEGGA